MNEKKENSTKTEEPKKTTSYSSKAQPAQVHCRRCQTLMED